MQYIILKDGRVIWGPRPWNPFAIEMAIERETQQDVTIGVDPVVGKILENPSIVILPVTQLIVPSYDPIFETLAGPTWRIDVSEGKAEMEYTVVEQHIPYAKGAVVEAAISKRKEKENSGITVDGIHFGTDRTTRERMFLQSALGQDVKWKNNDGTFVDLTISQLQSISQTINNHVQQAYAWEHQITNRINNCSSIADLKVVYAEIVGAE